MAMTGTLAKLAAPRAIGLAVAMLIGQLVAISFIYKGAIHFTCTRNWPQIACSGTSGVVVSLIGLLAALGLFAAIAPNLRRHFAQAGTRNWPLLVNLAGTVIALIPVLYLRDGAGPDSVVPTLALWLAGMLGILAGLALYAAPLASWAALLRERWTQIVPLALAGLMAPPLATLIRPIWQLEAVADVTFAAVSWLIRVLGYAVTADPTHKSIGAGDFFIQIAPVCSGVEGIALVAIFATIYLFLFRNDLRFPLALLLYPVGFAVSALLNVVRITVLLVIGLNGHPELAVGGFHSHAGWLMFTVVALLLIALAHGLPAFHRSPPVQPATARVVPVPLRLDPVAARIVPFAVFMFSALLASTFAQSPGVIYPLRMIAVGAAIALFWPIYARLPVRLDPVALLVGMAIGIFWVAVPVPNDAAAPYGTLSGAVLTGWFIVRGLGTIVLVPIVEELFFRDYLEGRIRGRSGAFGAVGAALITAALFAALHDRWVEAFIAGLAFSYVARRGRITDAIFAHAVSNAIVFAAALATGQMNIL